MPRVTCKIVDKPSEASATIFEMVSGLTDPFIRGEGSSTYTCGRCDNVLVENVYHGQFRGFILKCPRCRLYNEVP